MGVKPDHWIVKMAREQEMIRPFEESLVKAGKISYGPSSYGYDFRVDRHFKLFHGSEETIIDPKNLTEDHFDDLTTDCCIIPPNSFLLAQSVEYFKIPRDILTACFGKSTYARCGIVVNVTPFEPEWEGHVTMSISNTSPFPVKIYAGEGIAQLIFLKADELCRISYKDRKGKYQAQRGIVLAKVDENENP